MEQTDATDGWSLLAETDGAAALLDAALRLDPDEQYTSAELANAAGLTMKDLYLSDAPAVLADHGLFETVETDDGTAYRVDADSEAYEAAATFAAALSE